MLLTWIKNNFIWIVLVGIICFAIQTAIRSGTGYKRCLRIVSVTAGAVYMMALVYVTLSSRETGAEMKYELELFWSYRRIIQEGNRFLLWENAANIFAFIPLGMFLYDFVGEKLRWHQAVLAGAVCSALIECSQLIWRLGLFEFDDIFHNTLGTLLGYLLAVVVYKAVEAILCRFRLSEK